MPLPPPPAGAYVLQIGAYKSQADADAAWKTYKAKHAALLAAIRRMCSRPIWATRAPGIACASPASPTRMSRSALCDRLKADGGSCFLGK